ncbi:MAG: endopeptidase La [Deltaproteobacteria bacterium]|nr:endopeptidase La [Deltaproteobacteria bacterium]
MTEKNKKKTAPTDRIPAVLPILPLFDVVLFPKMVLPLIVKQKESIRLIDEVMAKDRLVGAVTSRSKQLKKSYSMDDLHGVGTSAVILKMAKTDENTVQILLQGIGRFKVSGLISDDPYITAGIETINPSEPEGKEISAMMSSLINQYQRVVELSSSLPPEIGAMANTIEEPGTLADMVTSTIGSATVEKQVILECFNVKKRLKEVMRLVAYQIEILEIGSKIQTQVRGDMDKQQREYYLRQQLKAIKEELGEKEAPNVELDELREKIKSGKLPEAAAKEAERELNRLARMHPSSAEYTVALTYLDWLTELPWSDVSEDRLDLKKARAVLDRDHYGLERAKKRILEYLAVLKLKPDVKGPILCFAGPPGTGKTSLGASIAKALGRKFVRMALGGARDEAEIRGHRRTYVGALPGRIIQGIRRAGTKNPVFMLDEVDKLGADYRGDPSAALLEVLDPEQNASFTDHYLDVAFDLSKVMFITTANRLDTIPPPLLDRMEVLRLSGYTLEEKTKIATRYLVPRQRSAHGLTGQQISITKGAVKTIISAYTQEAGVRNLEREIAGVCRGVASKIVNNEAEMFKVVKSDIVGFLGPAKFSSDEIKKRVSTPGVVMGLAWTPAGGDVLFIEATIMKGTGRLILTGQLGDVMKESAQAALSYIRSNAKALEIDEERFSKTDIHVHVPAGAIPKDGPSAGVTMLTALASIFTDTPTSKNLAMTGEITLRGRVLAVGGIKEKMLAAHRAGIRTIILPESNEKDLEDLPENVREQMTFHFAANMRNVIRIALGR